MSLKKKFSNNLNEYSLKINFKFGVGKKLFFGKHFDAHII